MQTTRRERLLAYGFVAMIVLGLLWQLAAGAFAQEPASITRGAAIRSVDGVWGPIVNSAHANTMVASVVVESDGDDVPVAVEILGDDLRTLGAMTGFAVAFRGVTVVTTAED
jgi:hypothetical protein